MFEGAAQMRRALFGLILAASALTPAAAIAQHHGHGGGDGDGRGEARAQSPRQSRAPAQVQVRPQGVQRQGGNWQGRADFQANRVNATPRAVTPRGDRGNRGVQGRPGSIYPQAWQGNPNDPRLRHYQQLERRNQYRYGTPQQRQEIRRYDRRSGARSGRDWTRDWNRGWRSDRRYDWNRYRIGNRGLFHLSPYYAPYRNWHYRRFSIGLFLDPLFYGRSYWIGDPFYYRLPPAPPGTEWVRYYNDVLLVDVYTGEVVDAIYDFFW
jgi:hypothetical protein